MDVSIRAMATTDYAEVLALWRRSAGIGLNESDSETATAAFLARNPGMSAVARDADGALLAAVLCGWDGRRGYLHHLAVDAAHRGRGVARRLLKRCYAELEQLGVAKCNIFLFRDHDAGAAFWKHEGWIPRDDLLVCQKLLAGADAGDLRTERSC